ncbi:MAG: hypothetical protein AAB583_06590 [Patescibacteria group bacterium]
MNLLSKYPKYEKRFSKTNIPDQSELNNMRNEIVSFDENVAFCFSFLKGIVSIYFSSISNGIRYFSATNDDSKQKDLFINECIEPILFYLELQIKSTLNATYILKRYKIFCEWYGRNDFLADAKEPDITRKHLARFLFDSGFTYPLVEVDVPSGKIDNLTNTPYAIIVEAKIHRNGSPQSTFEKIYNQAYKRTQDLNFREAFCIVFNKEKIEIVVDNSEGHIENFFYKTKNNSRIYFLIINLYKVHSEDGLPQKRVDFKALE